MSPKLGSKVGVFLAISGIVGCTAPANQQSRAKAKDPALTQALLSWVGKSIADLPVEELKKFKSYVEKKLTNDDGVEHYFIGRSLIFENHGSDYVWKFDSATESQFLVFLNPHTLVVPSSEHAWLYIVNAAGDPLVQSDFDTGYRMCSAGARYSNVDWLKNPVLIQEMRVGMNGGGPRKIFIAFDGNRPAVVRIEDEKGAIKPMPYFAPNWVVGPKFSPPSVGEPDGALTGHNEVKCLEALVWLWGRHQRASANQPDHAHEELSEEQRFADCMKSPEIRGHIRSLRMSTHSYVAQLAEMIDVDHNGDSNLREWFQFPPP